MLNAQATQFTLNDEGQVLYQAAAGNPLPGEAVARVQKGGALLEPEVVLLDAPIIEGQDKKALTEFLQTWLKTHVQTVLAPLAALQNDPALQDAVKEIADQVYAASGIVPREEIENHIAGLDQDTRRVLREKGIKLGPVLVFLPDLNKPAAVRLRGLLWCLFHGKALPASVPNDGVVSFEVDPESIDPAFYRAIGYPVYGKRAVRIDMLDRVISAVYDAAKDGKFQAQHQMAEWLGCSIESLYDVLHAMGHRKIYDPAEQQEEQGEPPAEKSKETEEKSEEDAQSSAGQAKPELATFRLKKGKAHEKEQKRPQKKPQAGKIKSGKRNKKTNKTPRVMEAGPKPKPEDSPFAVLEQLKVQKKAQ